MNFLNVIIGLASIAFGIYFCIKREIEFTHKYSDVVLFTIKGWLAFLVGLCVIIFGVWVSFQ
jgi:hypothetical protein